MVGVATLTFSAAIPTMAATTLGATNPTVVVRTIAAVAASLLAAAAFLLLLLPSRPQHDPSCAIRMALTRARVGAAFSWSFQELWFMANHVFRTESSSVGEGGIAAATTSRARSARVTASYARAVAKAASCSAFSAASVCRCSW